MKTKSATVIALLTLMTTPLLSARSFVDGGAVRAKSIAPVVPHAAMSDRLMKMGDRMVIVKNGAALPMTSAKVLSDGTRVTIDGTVTSKNGSRMKLRDCAAIGMDGKRIDDSVGRIVVIDGQVMVMKGGVTRRLEMVAHLGDGKSVDQDCILTDRKGGQTELKEGQILAMNTRG